jgi:hypothetical protein
MIVRCRDLELRLNHAGRGSPPISIATLTMQVMQVLQTGYQPDSL